MSLRAPKQPPKDTADWDRWTRDVEVIPDNQSVGTEALIDGAVTEPKLGSGSASNRVLRDSAANSVIGRSAATAGDPADIALAEGQFLGTRAGVTAGFALIDANIPATIARDSEVASAIAAHEAAADPHPQYLTAAEGSAAYQPLTAALGLIYSGAGDPNGVVTATGGALFLRTDGGAGSTLYSKAGGGNTGWSALS